MDPMGYDVLNSLAWVRNQRQRHRSPTIYSTLDCFIKQKESILEYNPLLILPYIWWLWSRKKALKFDGFSTHGTLQPLGNPGNRPSASSTFWQRPKVCNSTPPSMALPRAWQTRMSWEWEQNLWQIWQKKWWCKHHMVHSYSYRQSLFFSWVFHLWVGHVPYLGLGFNHLVGGYVWTCVIPPHRHHYLNMMINNVVAI